MFVLEDIFSLKNNKGDSFKKIQKNLDNYWFQLKKKKILEKNLRFIRLSYNW